MSTSGHDLPTLVASQKKKLWLLGGMFVAVGIGFLFTAEIAYVFGVAAVSVQLGTLLSALGTFATALLTIRCSNCGLRLVLYAMSRKGVGEWLEWLLTAKICPRCGLPHEVSPKS